MDENMMTDSGTAAAAQGAVSVMFREDGSLLLKNGMMLLAENEDGEAVSFAAERLVVGPYVYGEHWKIDESSRIGTDHRLLIRGGVLSSEGDGSFRIEGSEASPVIVDLVPEEQAQSVVCVDFRGKLASVQTPAEEAPTEEVPGEITAEDSPAPEAVTVEWTDESLRFSNPMSFHALDTERGWHVEEHVGAVILEGYPEGKAWASELDGQEIPAGQILSIRGGVCTKQDDNALIITGSESAPLSVALLPAEEAHEQHEGVCVEYQGLLAPVPTPVNPGFPSVVLGGAVLAAALLGALAGALLKGRKEKPAEEASEPAPAAKPEPVLGFGKLQNIGKRSSQQDSFMISGVQGGLLAAVADGMGGLKNGDAVSQKIVKTLSEDCKRYSAEQLRGNLLGLIAHANDEVTRMLGTGELFRSGSTLLTVLAEPRQFSWVSIGDSRIYLYRAGRLLQLNREHNYEAELLLKAVNHQGSFQEARNHPKRRSVSSFIGMGTLRYIDEMPRPVRTVKGDRIILSSDGVFNTLREPQIEAILADYPDPKLAAQKLEEAVLAANNPYQDNFTAILISYD